MAFQQVRVNGFKELHKALQQLPERVQKNVSRRVVGAGANTIRDEARQEAPVNTGTLKKNIIARMSRGTKTLIMAKVFVRKLSGKRLERIKQRVASGKARLTPAGKYKGDAFYWLFVHFGTKPHQIPKKPVKGKSKFIKAPGYPHPIFKTRHPGAKKRPFLSDAFEAKKYEVVEKIKTGFARGIEQEAAKLYKFQIGGFTKYF